MREQVGEREKETLIHILPCLRGRFVADAWSQKCVIISCTGAACVQAAAQLAQELAERERAAAEERARREAQAAREAQEEEERAQQRQREARKAIPSFPP